MSRIIHVTALAAVALGLASAATAQTWGGPLGMMGHYDANGDGKVSFAEFDSGRNDQFMDMDNDSDQALTPAEIDAYMQQRMSQWQGQGGAGGGGHHHEQGGDWQKKRADDFARSDTNHDGKMSLTEYKAASASRFKDMDSNHDGFVDAGEVAAVRGH